MQEPARIAIDLGAESCRVSLLRWSGDKPEIEVTHRIPNGPTHRGESMYWDLNGILTGLEEGLRKAANAAPEGIASIAVDGWGVDYVRLAPDGRPLQDPFCYRDERNTAAKEAADKIISSFDLYQRTGVYPLKLNTVYQLLADPAAGIDPRTPWISMPEYILYSLGARRVSEYSHASHTGLVDIKTRNWAPDIFRLLDLPIEAAPEIVPAGTILGRLKGPLASLDAFRETQLIAPACHDTASAIAGIPTDLSSAAYMICGTWSIVGTLATEPVTTRQAFDARYMNLGAATGNPLFHSLVNGMWLFKQSMDAWAAEGRPWTIEDLIAKAGACNTIPGILEVDAEPLMLDSNMPALINSELTRLGFDNIPDVAGNEPIFSRLIFESLAARYASALSDLEQMLGRKLERIHMLGGANRNKLLVELTEKHTGLPVEVGEAESSTIGNLAVQLAASEANGQPITSESVRKWAKCLCKT